MTDVFPSAWIAKQAFSSASGDDGNLVHTVTVAAQRYAVLYKLWVSHDATADADVENLNDPVTLQIVFGSTALWVAHLHPLVNYNTVKDIYPGPWAFDFGQDGLYSGTRGENMIITLFSFGTTLASRMNTIYSGDSIASTSA